MMKTLMPTHNNTGNHTVSSTMFRVSQVTFTIGMGFLCVSTIFMYIILFSDSFKRSVMLATLKTALLFLAGLLFMIALVITGQHYPDDPDFYYLSDYNTELGWSFYVGIAGNVIVFLSAIASTYNLVLLRSTEVPYENLYVST